MRARNRERGEGEQRGAEMIQLCRDDRLQTRTRAGQWGISFEPQPEIEFKVLRIRVKCQKGQLGDLFRLA